MQIALDLGTSVALLSLAWCLKNEFVTTAITGASKVSQLKENLKVFEIVKLLDDEVMERIEKVLDNKIEYPIY